jgi:hypothetical protein
MRKYMVFGRSSVTSPLALVMAGALLIQPAYTAEAASKPTPAGTTSENVILPNSLDTGFRNPPQSARPRVWWHWMNGNITQDGVKKDLDWMARIGLGGVQNFDAALQTPQIVDKRLVYMTPEWKGAFRFAAGLAEQNKLELTVAASPGWSETGGPWVKPEDGMKKLVWSELVVDGKKPVKATLAKPSSVTGPFQDIPRNPNLAAANVGKPDPTYYADIAVLAYPLPAGAKVNGALKLTTASGEAVAAAPLLDGKYQTTVNIPRGTREAPGELIADLGALRTIRSLSLSVSRAAAMFQPPSVLPRLEAEGTDGTWRKIVDMPLDGGVQTTVSFDPVTARRFRLVFTQLPPRPDNGLGSVPGAVVRALFQQGASTTISLAELNFSEEPRVDRFEVKAGFGIVPNYYALEADAPADGPGIAPDKVVNLTDRLRPDGTLDWTPPAGTWRVVRLGYSLVGTTNHPAPEEATGLEVDKFDGRAVKAYVETYIGMLREATGPDLIGDKGLRAILTDSIEVGASNWTPELIAKFKALRGYDPVPWLPALTGTVIGSRAQSDKFLYDFRTTLSDLITSEHYGQVAETAHAHGLKVYGESLEAGRPTFGDDMAMRSHADVPMAALWTYDPNRGPRMGLLGDMKGASSVAHVYGQNIAAAESLTAAFSPWAFAPSDLKPALDLELAYGINRPIIHTSVHQPVDDKQPGLSLGPFGQYFNRHETWAEMARPWVDYISRSSFLLQQGRNFADVAYFYGEDAPLTVLYQQAAPADLPVHYAFDFVNRDIVLDELNVVDGDLVAKSGARYRVLYLGGTSSKMTLPVLKRIEALVEAGATVVGKAPTASPSLPDDASAFLSLTKRLWAGTAVTSVGKGRVIAASAVEEALASIGVPADFAASGVSASDILFVHRRLEASSDIYFLSNRKSEAVKTEARFRVSGKVPELWHADTGTTEAVSYRIEGEKTIVPLDLTAHDAVFIVFRAPAKKASLEVVHPELKPVLTVSGAWDLEFQPGRGAPDKLKLAELSPLNTHSDPGVKYFSGTITYTKSFDLPAGVRPGKPLVIDLGALGDVAEVRVNGTMAGTVWKAPYRLDIGRLVRSGQNRLEVRVANLWVNRLIGDAQPGAKQITFTTLPTYLPDAPLRPSGLIGPVILLQVNPATK